MNADCDPILDCIGFWGVLPVCVTRCVDFILHCTESCSCGKTKLTVTWQTVFYVYEYSDVQPFRRFVPAPHDSLRTSSWFNIRRSIFDRKSTTSTGKCYYQSGLRIGLVQKSITSPARTGTSPGHGGVAALRRPMSTPPIKK